MSTTATRRGRAEHSTGWGVPLLLLGLLSPSPVAAYQSPMRFIEPPETGGGGGRFFTGSPADNYTCKVCHTPGTAPHLRVSGFPLSGYVPGETHTIVVDWDDQLESVALNFEVTDSSGRPAGELVSAAAEELVPADYCEPAELQRPSVLVLPPMAGVRPIAVAGECGQHQATIKWTAPMTGAALPEEVWFVGSLVSADSDGTVAGDSVADFARVFGLRRRPAPVATEVTAGCRVLSGRAPHGAWLLLLLGAFAALCTRRRRRVSPAAVLLLALVASVPWLVRADALSSAVYVRTDSDDTLVVSPRAHAVKHFAETTQLDVAYAADIWTSASIDIRTAASEVVTEQRDELDVGIAQDLGDLTLSGSYRYSVENDYESHGGSTGMSLDVAENSTTLALSGYAFSDTVGKSGDAYFSADLATFGARASINQVLDPQTIAQLTYELSHLEGYQASPYRVVGIGGNGYGCMGAFLCLPERQPDVRTRHAIAALLRRAFGGALSLGANYRFYLDDWGLRSHTAGAQLGWIATNHTALTLRYRYYVQNGAEFYSAVYATPPSGDAFTTRDREQSPLNDHRIGVDLQHRFDLDDAGAVLAFDAGIGGDFYSYDDFVGLSRVSALELTLALTLER